MPKRKKKKEEARIPEKKKKRKKRECIGNSQPNLRQLLWLLDMKMVTEEIYKFAISMTQKLQWLHKH